jgi:hypothetical protein
LRQCKKQHFSAAFSYVSLPAGKKKTERKRGDFMADTEKMSDSLMRVRLFPTLELSDGVQSVGEEDIRSDMVVKLLSYLAYNHKRSCTAQELTAALWQDDESANPVGALKNLAYRLRTILKKP